MDLWRRVLRNLQKTLRSYHQVPEATILFQKQSPEGASKTQPPKNHRRSKKMKNLQWSPNTKRPLAVSIRLTKITLHHRLSPENTKSLRTSFLKSTFGELLLVFQLFKEFDSNLRFFILKFQKVFSHRIFKNGYTFLHFLRVCRNVLP